VTKAIQPDRTSTSIVVQDTSFPVACVQGTLKVEMHLFKDECEPSATSGPERYDPQSGRSVIKISVQSCFHDVRPAPAHNDHFNGEATNDVRLLDHIADRVLNQ
jgi:hypothetical protein